MSANYIVDILELFENMKNKGGMYFCDGTKYELVSSFIYGFMVAEDIYNTGKILSGFDEWLLSSIFHGRSGYSWDYLIWEEGGKDDKTATELLFTLIRKYLESK